MRRRLKHLGSFVIALAYSSPLLAQGNVNGVVIDTAGLEVSNASVQAMPRNDQSGGTVGSLSRWIQADKHGRFSIRLPAGRYKIVAKDESDGYPDPVFALCSDPSSNFPTISVGKNDVSGIRVSLGTKGGILEGHVNDAATQLPIPKVKVTISDAREPSAYVDVFTNAEGGFQFTVPSKPVVISASAVGYSTTQLNGGEELTLSGGEHRSIVVELNHGKPY